nr:DNA alkylation repair protein [Cellulomonas septica]
MHRHADERELAKTSRRMVGVPLSVVGVRMGTVFALAKEHRALPLPEVAALLERDEYESRTVGVSVLDFRARAPRLDDDGRQALYDLWMDHLDRIVAWDLIDRSAPRVVGLHLRHRSRDRLFTLAASPEPLHRRTAVVATFAIVRHGDVDDALAICALLAADRDPLVQNPVGTALREVGRVDAARRDAFLAAHATMMSAAARRVARSSGEASVATVDAFPTFPPVERHTITSDDVMARRDD